MENMEENCEMIWKIRKKSRLNSQMIWKIRKKSGLNIEMIWKVWKKIVKCIENMENREEKFFFTKTINTACNLFKFTLCPTVRGNNSVSEGITL
jgi:hypothetical protein